MEDQPQDHAGPVLGKRRLEEPEQASSAVKAAKHADAGAHNPQSLGGSPGSGSATPEDPAHHLPATVSRPGAVGLRVAAAAPPDLARGDEPAHGSSKFRQSALMRSLVDQTKLHPYTPIDTNTGRRGLGFVLRARKPQDAADVLPDNIPDRSQEDHFADELYTPLPCSDLTSEEKEILLTWTPNFGGQDGPPHADPERVDQMNRLKTGFDDYYERVGKQRFNRPRNAANPWELIKSEGFQNRAAIKLANLDHIFKLTAAASETEGPFMFGDIAAGPGGFSEYLLFRIPTAVGFGMTLRGREDFNIAKFAPCCNTTLFNRHYGRDGTGDLTKEANLVSYESVVALGTGNRGVHLLLADGGFDVSKDFNKQELVSRRMYLGECCAAVMVMRKGGTFVCKFFDTHTDFTLELLYILSRCFESFILVKPHDSRPANSERYAVFRGFKYDFGGKEAAVVRTHLLRVVNGGWSNDPFHIEAGISHVLPHSVASGPAYTQFVDYVRQYNDWHLDQQNYYLRLLQSEIDHQERTGQTRTLFNQKDIRDHFLGLWKVPSWKDTRATPRRSENEARVLVDTRRGVVQYNVLYSNTYPEVDASPPSWLAVPSSSVADFGILAVTRHREVFWRGWVRRGEHNLGVIELRAGTDIDISDFVVPLADSVLRVMRWRRGNKWSFIVVETLIHGGLLLPTRPSK